MANANAIAARFDSAADTLRRKIDNNRAHRLDNTPKRARQAMSARIDADNMERCQMALRLLARLHRTGSVPVELADVRTRNQVHDLVRHGIVSNGYYHVAGSGQYADSSPAGRALQSLLDGSASPADREAAEARSRENRVAELISEVKFSKIPGYFPTPPELARQMVQLAGIAVEHQVLEPSAGSGNIADAIRESVAGKVDLTLIEVNHRLCEILRTKGYSAVFCTDFMLTMKPDNKFDRVVMNPPFENGQDIDHVRHAYELLKPGGRLVAIMSAGSFFRQDRRATEFRDWIHGGGPSGVYDRLPDGAFKLSGTEVSAYLVVLDKPGSGSPGPIEKTSTNLSSHSSKGWTSQNFPERVIASTAITPDQTKGRTMTSTTNVETANVANKWRPAHQRVRQIESRFRGKCESCGMSFERGVSIYYAKGAGARCMACGPHSADIETASAPAPVPALTPNSEPIPTEPVLDGRASDTDLASVIARAVAGHLPPANATIDEARIREIAAEVVIGSASAVAKAIEIKRDGATIGVVDGAHESFAEVAGLIAAGFRNVLLVGPAGSGKTTLAKAVAKGLGVPFGFISLSAGITEVHLTGRVLPDESGAWKFKPSRFVEMYQTPGVYLLDELDAADANVMVAINAALANGCMALPDGSVVERHPEFVLIAAANTYGRGADMQYVGRNALDAATLDRFTLATVYVDYDAALERSLAANVDCGDDLIAWVVGLRTAIATNRIRRVASTRLIVGAVKLLVAGQSLSAVCESFLRGWTPDERAKVPTC